MYSKDIGNLDMVKILLPTMSKGKINELLLYSSHYGHIHIAKYILDDYILNVSYTNIMSMVYNSIMYNQADFLNFILDYTQITVNDFIRCIHLAVQCVNLDIIKLLMTTPNIEIENRQQILLNEGPVLLTYALGDGNQEIITYLLDVGVDIYDQDDSIPGLEYQEYTDRLRGDYLSKINA